MDIVSTSSRIRSSSRPKVVISQTSELDSQLKWLLRYGFFSGFPEEQVSQFLEGSRIIESKPGDRLFRVGESADCFGFVLTGAYKFVLLDPNGDEVIMHFSVRGEPLGVMATMEAEHRFPFDFVAMTESKCLVIPRKAFLERWIYNPRIMLRYQNSLQGRIFRSHDEKRLQQCSLAERVADLLLYLAESKSTRTGVIEIPITRREIASYVGASVESVIRILSNWGRQGFIKSEGKCILIRKICALRGLISGAQSGSQGRSLKEEACLAALWHATEVNAARGGERRG